MFNFLSSREEVKFYLSIIFSIALLIAAYGIFEYFFPYKHHPFSYPFYYRIYERGFFYHDANHFAAYLMFIASLIFGICVFLKKNIATKIILFLLFLTLCFPLFWTYSRGAYIALFISLLLISGIRSKKVFIFTLILSILLILFFAPASVIDRIYSIKDSFLSNNPYSSSIAYRLQQIKYALRTVKEYPLLGIGLAARSRVFYENQFIMFLSELGIIGLTIFLFLIFTIFSVAVTLYKSTNDSSIKGFSAGYIGGLLGLLIECNTLVVFLISRIMIPFWITTALIFWLFINNKKDERIYT